MSLTRRIAARFLRSKKSHGAVSAIAAVSVAGVAVATAAVVCVLSVFNGFHEVLVGKLDILAPDVEIAPVRGKTIPAADSLAEALSAMPEVALAMPAVREKALALAGYRELPVTLYGVVPESYRRITSVDSIIFPGGRMPEEASEAAEPEFDTYEDYEEWLASGAGAAKSESLLSIGVAARLGGVQPGEPVLIFAPRREGRLNPANPAASFMTDSVTVTGVYEAHQSDYDQDMMVVPISTARRLLQYDGEASILEVKAAAGTAPAQLAGLLRSRLGDGYRVRDRLELQQINFRMVNIEKWVSFLLLFFILVIASFNIITTMSMLVLEKQNQLGILSSLGMPASRIGSVFRWESLYVSLAGAAAGILLGLVLCLPQQRYGLLRLSGDPSTLLMPAYPVKVVWTDIPVILIPTALISAATAWITGRFARTRTAGIDTGE